MRPRARPWPPGRRACKANPCAPDKLHLTLAFLGQRPASELPALLDILAQLPARAMPLVFDHASHFPKLALAWAALAQPSPALLDLRAACMHGLAEQGLAPRFEHDRFTPHVTLARQAPPPATGLRARRLAGGRTGAGGIDQEQRRLPHPGQPEIDLGGVRHRQPICPGASFSAHARPPPCRSWPSPPRWNRSRRNSGP